MRLTAALAANRGVIKPQDDLRAAHEGSLDEPATGANGANRKGSPLACTAVPLPHGFPIERIIRRLTLDGNICGTLSMASLRIIKLTRFRSLPNAGSKTLFFKYPHGKSGRFLRPAQVPEFDGEAAWFEVEVSGTRVRFIRQMGENGKPV